MNFRTLLLAIIIMAAMLLLQSCVIYRPCIRCDLEKELDRGTAQSTIMEALGGPDRIIGSLTTIYGQRVDVWEYKKNTSIPSVTEHELFWVYFVDQKYERISRPGYWLTDSVLLSREVFEGINAPGNAALTIQDFWRINDVYLKNEFGLGLGAANSFEQRMFKVPAGDVSGGINPYLSLRYIRYLDDHWGIGANLFGYVKSIDNVPLTGTSGTRISSLELMLMNAGGEVRYRFARHEVEPYVFGGIAYVGGSLNEQPEVVQRLKGANFTAGAGLAIPIREQFIVTVEAAGTIGTAKWSDLPFLNSESRNFDPSMAVLLVQASYRFGR